LDDYPLKAVPGGGDGQHRQTNLWIVCSNSTDESLWFFIGK